MKQLQLVDEFFSQVTHSDPYQVEKAKAAIVGYFHYYGDETTLYDVVGVETPYQLPIPDLDGENHIGFIDYLLRNKKTGKLIIADLKTAGYVSDEYWQELATNEQLTEYSFSLRQAGYTDLEVRWDVILKPSISPKELTKAAKAEIETGSYLGMPLKSCAIPMNGKESAEMYGIRCLNWYLESPEARYVRRTHERDEHELLSHWENLCRRVKLIREQERQFKEEKDQFGEPLLPLPTYQACKRFGDGNVRMCDFHLICSGNDPDRTCYQEKQKPPSRTVELDGFSVSRLRTHGACQREHHFKYVEKIEPRIKSSSQALDFGTLFHSAFEHVMRGIQTEKLALPLGNE